MASVVLEEQDSLLYSKCASDLTSQSFSFLMGKIRAIIFHRTIVRVECI